MQVWKHSRLLKNCLIVTLVLFTLTFGFNCKWLAKHLGENHDLDLIAAVDRDDLSTVKQLLREGANPNATRPPIYCGDSLLHEEKEVIRIAADHGNIEIIQALVEQKSDVEVYPGFGGRLLRRAASGDHTQLVNMLLSKGINVDSIRPEIGNTALHIAAEYGTCGVARILLESGADGSRRNCWGWTPAMLAELNEKDDMVELISRYEPNLKEDEKTRVLMYQAALACDLHNFRRFSKEIDFCLDRDFRGNSFLTSVARSGCFDLIQELEDYGCDFEILEFSDGGFSALMRATLKNDLRMVEMLAERGVSFDAIGSQGETALIISLVMEFYDIAQYLINLGADVTITDFSGNSPLMFAASGGNMNVFLLCLEKDADPMRKNCKGMNALDFAKKGNNPEIVDLILKRMKAYPVPHKKSSVTKFEEMAD